MIGPERRTRSDVAAAALIMTVLLGLAAVLWWTSDVRMATLHTASRPLPTTANTNPGTLPSSLTEVWRASSAATRKPILLGGAAVTGHAGTVSGRELTTGDVRWRYARELPLCTVGAAFDRVVAVYRNEDNCSEITSFDPTDGTRGPQRNSPLEASTSLVAQSGHVVATGRRYLEVWRSDLVRTLQYGALPTPVKPDGQPRTGCRYGSVAAAPGLVGVTERCPGESADRLSVLRADPEDTDVPVTVHSTLLPGRDASLVALTTDRAAVALPDPARLVLFDGSGNKRAEYALDVPVADLRGDPPGRVVPVSETPAGPVWFTGSATVALDAQLRPRWTVPNTLGAGTMLAGRLLVPVPEGLAVLDPATGRRQELLRVDRGGYRGPVAVAAAGGIVFELRGDTLVALETSAS